MPAYELALILRSTLRRPELKTSIKRSCETIINHGGYIRGFENLGEKLLPYKMKSHGHTYTHGWYFIVNFDSAVEQIRMLQIHLHKDQDIIRPGILRKMEKFVRPCQYRPCEFGEMTPYDYERRAWKKRVTNAIHTPLNKVVKKR